jgi:hypothetical protein
MSLILSFSGNLTCLLCNQSSVGLKLDTKIKQWGYDNVLPEKGCHKTQGAAIDEYGAVVE